MPMATTMRSAIAVAPAMVRPSMLAVLALAGAVLLMPLFLVEIPPLLDYPNHLARLYLLATGLEDPALARMYAAHWAIIPDLAIDATVPWLMRWLPVYVAGKVMLGCILLLTVGGVLAYSRAVFGARRWWAVASVLAAYNVTFMLGFLNFVVSTSLALLFAAGWITWRDRRPMLVVTLASLGTAVLFLSHLAGLAFFLILVASAELEHVWRVGRRGDGWVRVLLVRMAVAAPLVVAPLGLYSRSNFSAVSTQAKWLWLWKLWEAPGILVNYDPALDAISAILVFGFVALCLIRRWGVVAPKSVVAAAVLAGMVVALPFSLMGTHFLDLRPAIMLGLLAFAGFTPAGLSTGLRRGAIGMVGLVFGVRMALIAVVWAGHQANIDQLRAVTARVEPGSRVFLLDIQPGDAPEYWAAMPGWRMSMGFSLSYHLPAILLIERHALYPNLFADPAQQPLVRLQPYDDLAHEYWLMPHYRQLKEDAAAFGAFACRADYLLMMQAGAEPNLRQFGAGALELLEATDLAALYRVTAPCPAHAAR